MDGDIQAQADVFVQRLAEEWEPPDWQRAIKHIARAQALLWYEASMADRKAALAKAEELMRKSGE